MKEKERKKETLSGACVCVRERKKDTMSRVCVCKGGRLIEVKKKYIWGE